MHILIDQYGVSVEVEDKCFKISNEQEARLVSIYKISSINFLKTGSISTAALVLAAQRQIPLLFYNNYGQVEARVWSIYHSNIATIRQQQAFFTYSKQALFWMQELLEQKKTEQLKTLGFLKNRVKSSALKISDNMVKIEAQNKLDSSKLSFENLRIYEAHYSRWYWQAMAIGLEKFTTFDKREKQYAQTAFNVCLNYCYGMLYGIVESSLLMVGLDPFMGIMHANQYKKAALSFDHIEPFRAWADRLVMQLFMQGQIEETKFVKTENYLSIDKESKKILISAFLNFLDEKVYFNEKRIKRVDQIHALSKALVNVLKKIELKSNDL